MNRNIFLMAGFLLGLGWVSVQARPGEGYGDWSRPKAVSNPQTPYDQGQEAVQRGDFQSALAFFQQANQQTPNNPDVLNMLAYTQRNVGQIDESIMTYKQALQLRPDFPQAHEYLGEAYIKAVLREIDILSSYGEKGKKDHDDLVKALKEAAAQAK